LLRREERPPRNDGGLAVLAVDVFLKKKNYRVHIEGLFEN